MTKIELFEKADFYKNKIDVNSNEYINALIVSQRELNPDIDTFIKFIAECVNEAERDYCRLLRLK